MSRHHSPASPIPARPCLRQCQPRQYCRSGSRRIFRNRRPARRQSHRQPPEKISARTLALAHLQRRCKSEDQAGSHQRMRPEQARVRPHRSPKTHHQRSKRGPSGATPESQAQKKQAHRRQCGRQRDCARTRDVRQRCLAARRFQINSHHPQRRPRGQCKGQREKHHPWRLIGIVVPLEVCLVLRVLMVGIDLQGVALDNGAQQIEAGVLIPPPALIEVNERKEDYDAEQDCGLAMGRRFF